MSSLVALPRRQLAVAFGPETMRDALDHLPRICASNPDLVELRLDAIQDRLDLGALFDARAEVPVIATLRPPDQGGRSPLDVDERLRVLLGAVERGAEYVDLEWTAASPDAMKRLRAAGARAVIVSRHDFGGMPDLQAWWEELAGLGADVVKVVGAAGSPLDCRPVLQTLAGAHRPSIAIAMGDAGSPSRVVALREDACFLTYAAPDDRPAGTAPGQMTLSELRDVYHARRVGSQTTVFGLLGRMPDATQAAACNRWFQERGLDAIVVSSPVGSETSATRVAEGFRPFSWLAGWRIEDTDLQEEAGEAIGERKVNSLGVAPNGEPAGSWVDSLDEQLDQWASRVGS